MPGMPGVLLDHVHQDPAQAELLTLAVGPHGQAVKPGLGPQRGVAAICIGPDDDMERRRRDIVDAAAASGDPLAIAFPRGMTGPRDARYDFSFSGLKTAVARHVEGCERRGEEAGLLLSGTLQLQVDNRTLLLAAGEKDMRFTLPNSRIMVHQPSGGFQGQATDIMLHAQEILNLKKRLNEIYVKHTGQTYKAIEDALERDKFLTAEDAKAFGLVDKVIDKRPEDPSAAKAA